MNASVPGYTLILFNSPGPAVKCSAFSGGTNVTEASEMHQTACLRSRLPAHYHGKNEKRADIFYHSPDASGCHWDRSDFFSGGTIARPHREPSNGRPENRCRP